MVTITVSLDQVFSWYVMLSLIALSLVALFAGSLPDHGGSRWSNAMRWVVWPSAAAWFAFAVLRGIHLF